jgi:hypothetical protein
MNVKTLQCNVSTKISAYQALRALNWEQGTGNSKKKPARILGVAPLNLFMKKNKNIFFETRSARKNTSLYKSPDFNYGDFPVACCPFPVPF